LKKIRLLHRYMGLFFSQAILFFAFSGAMQTFNLHEVNKTTGYVPPKWIVEMAQIHKKQTFALAKEKAKPVVAESALRDPAAQKKVAPRRSPTFLLRCFVLAMSVGLVATTFLGIYMAFRYDVKRRILWGMLIGGTLLPIVLMLV
jgi:hypothetical protein